MDQEAEDVTGLLAEGSLRSEQVAARLIPLVYDELRRLAGSLMRNERPDHTLQPTALVHEAYMRMVRQDRVDWKGKTHFLGVAALQMRRILVEHARAVKAQKRGAGWRRVTLADDLVSTPEATGFLALDEALTRLSQRHERQGHVAELRLFAGLDVRELALAVGVSERTVKQDWRVAKAWLLKELYPANA